MCIFAADLRVEGEQTADYLVHGQSFYFECLVLYYQKVSKVLSHLVLLVKETNKHKMTVIQLCYSSKVNTALEMYFLLVQNLD